MIFNITGIQRWDSTLTTPGYVDVTTTAADLAYCVKVSRPAWYKDGNYTNAGIDSLVISVNPSSEPVIGALKFGSEIKIKIKGAISAIATTFKVTDITRVSSNSVRVYLMPKLGEALEESAN